MLVNLYIFRKMAILGITLGILGILSGCKTGWFHDRSDDYVHEKSIPALKIPKDTHSGSFSEEYQIPAK